MSIDEAIKVVENMQLFFNLGRKSGKTDMMNKYAAALGVLIQAAKETQEYRAMMEDDLK